MAIEENAENMQDVISQHFMQRMDFANPAQWHIIRCWHTGSFHEFCYISLTFFKCKNSWDKCKLTDRTTRRVFSQASQSQVFTSIYEEFHGKQHAPIRKKVQGFDTDEKNHPPDEDR